MFFLRITIPAAVLAVAACGAGRPAASHEQSRSKAKPQPPANLPITMDAARATALARVPGQVTEEEIELEHGRWVYEFDIRPDQPMAAMAPTPAAPAAPAAPASPPTAAPAPAPATAPAPAPAPSPTLAPRQEVTVDATTGQIVKVEPEDDSHDENDGKRDDDDDKDDDDDDDD